QKRYEYIWCYFCESFEKVGDLLGRSKALVVKKGGVSVKEIKVFSI
ncbi:MAG: hypothetical protein QG641_1540, partial [Candidatus Poribacteria bacterium]|nr:hypothetical protein [Candidatus Poribacteria bacterium]